jgi:hypothetical protein
MATTENIVSFTSFNGMNNILKDIRRFIHYSKTSDKEITINSVTTNIDGNEIIIQIKKSTSNYKKFQENKNKFNYQILGCIKNGDNYDLTIYFIKNKSQRLLKFLRCIRINFLRKVGDTLYYCDTSAEPTKMNNSNISSIVNNLK